MNKLTKKTKIIAGSAAAAAIIGGVAIGTNQKAKKATPKKVEIMKAPVMVKKSKVEICYDEILADHKSTTGYGCDEDGRAYKLPSTAGKKATRNTPKPVIKVLEGEALRKIQLKKLKRMMEMEEKRVIEYFNKEYPGILENKNNPYMKDFQNIFYFKNPEILNKKIDAIARKIFANKYRLSSADFKSKYIDMWDKEVSRFKAIIFTEMGITKFETIKELKNTILKKNALNRKDRAWDALENFGYEYIDATAEEKLEMEKELKELQTFYHKTLDEYNKLANAIDNDATILEEIEQSYQAIGLTAAQISELEKKGFTNLDIKGVKTLMKPPFEFPYEIAVKNQQILVDGRKPKTSNVQSDSPDSRPGGELISPPSFDRDSTPPEVDEILAELKELKKSAMDKRNEIEGKGKKDGYLSIRDLEYHKQDLIVLEHQKDIDEYEGIDLETIEADIAQKKLKIAELEEEERTPTTGNTSPLEAQAQESESGNVDIENLPIDDPRKIEYNTQKYLEGLKKTKEKLEDKIVASGEDSLEDEIELAKTNQLIAIAEYKSDLVAEYDLEIQELEKELIKKQIETKKAEIQTYVAKIKTQEDQDLVKDYIGAINKIDYEILTLDETYIPRWRDLWTRFIDNRQELTQARIAYEKVNKKYREWIQANPNWKKTTKGMLDRTIKISNWYDSRIRYEEALGNNTINLKDKLELEKANMVELHNRLKEEKAKATLIKKLEDEVELARIKGNEIANEHGLGSIEQLEAEIDWRKALIKLENFVKLGHTDIENQEETIGEIEGDIARLKEESEAIRAKRADLREKIRNAKTSLERQTFIVEDHKLAIENDKLVGSDKPEENKNRLIKAQKALDAIKAQGE